jgi:HSP20 family protein
MTRKSNPNAFIGYRDEFLKPFDLVFDQMLNAQFPNFFEQTGIDFEKGSYPKCNIVDIDEFIEVHAEIPGLTKEDVSISVEDGVLTISGSKKHTITGDAKYIRRELKNSTFRRSFTLGDTLDPTGITAKFENGMLLITIPKKEESKPRKIDITID